MTTDTDAGPSRIKEKLKGLLPRASEQEVATDASQEIASWTSSRRISDDQSMHFNEFPYYSMQHKRRGTALIFNMEHFKYMPTRRGTDRDEKHLEQCLRKLGFDVVVKENSTADQIKREIISAAQEDHRDDDCFLCVFLTHGDDGVIHGSDSLTSKPHTSVKLQEDVFDQFRGEKCETLIGKPKIFVIQACRGETFESGVLEADSVEVDSKMAKPEVEEGNKPTIPSGADFLICYSSSQGFYSFRNTQDGSWYVSALCEELTRHGTEEELTKILTKVHHRVSRRSSKSSDPTVAGKKQMPCYASMLTKQLFFSSR